MCSRESKVSDVVYSQQAFFELFKNQNAHTNLFLHHSYRTTLMSQQVTTISWNPQKRVVAFGSHSSLLSAKELI
jgi:hypothetical protein